MLETFTFEKAVSIAAPFAKKLFKEKITPLIDNKIKGYFKNKEELEKFEKESVKYIQRLSGQSSTLNTIAFQNTPKKLEDLYIPLTIKSDNDEIYIDEKSDVFKCHNHILINDTAGMGKSTLSKRIILNILEKEELIPVFIELRKLDDKPLVNQISSLFGLEYEGAINILKKLPLLYVFDGMDEISHDIKPLVINKIKDFVSDFSESKILITSRKETYLSEFYGFKHYSIKPLLKDEAFSLISKYDPTGKISNKLILGIKSSKGSDLESFLSTPLYVSLLFCSYRFKTVIPQKKHLFYSQVYDALFESHDLSKEVGYVRKKHSKLDSAEFHSVLRRLGFWCLKSNGQIEFTKDELEIIVTKIVKGTNSIDTNANDFVRDLTSTVPLFVKEGSTIRWSHKSLMEYFASMFICNDAKEKQKLILSTFYNSNRWSTYENVFELCFDIDYNSMRSSVIKETLESYVTHEQETYTLIKNSKIKESDIVIRKALTFAITMQFIVAERGLFRKKHFGNDILFINSDEFVTSNLVIGLESRNVIRCICKEGRERMIVRILKNKAPHLFLTDIPVEFRNLSKIKDSTICDNKAHLINDNPKKVMNNSKNFHLVNLILNCASVGMLDIHKVNTELCDIENDSSDGVDDLLDGLVLNPV